MGPTIFPASLPASGLDSGAGLVHGAATSPQPLAVRSLLPPPNSVLRLYQALGATYIRFVPVTDGSYPMSLSNVEGFLHLITRKGFFSLKVPRSTQG